MIIVEIDVGQVIAGKYELVRLIGKGAMGEVWLATHDSLGGEFAIKLVKPSEDQDDENVAGRFQLEAQISAKLSRRTRHIISVSDHGEENGLAYLVMELLDGESLEAHIKRVGALPLPETIAIVMQIARALEQAHAEGIIHRDLKPANVFLTRDEDRRLLVKVLDFGIARSTKAFRTRSPVMTGKDMVLGTPSYMSPEQARGLDSLDHRCDVWALAVVAFESLTGDIPWEGRSLEDIFLSICTHQVRPILALRPDLPPALASVFERSFTEKLNARFGTARELSDALEALVDPDAVEAATGPRLAPASSRRLPSDADLGGAMAMAPIRDRTDPHGVAIGGPHDLVPIKRSAGWLIGAVAAIVTLGVVLLGLRSFRNRDVAVPATPPSTPVATATSASVPTPAEPVAPPPTTVAPVVTTKPAPAPVAKGSRRAVPPVPPPVAVVPGTTPPPAVVAPPPPPAAAPVRSAPPPVAADKSGVF